MRQSEAVRAHFNVLSIFCGASFAGVAIFSGVVWYLLSSGSMPPGDLDLPPWSGMLLNVIALVVLMKASFLPRLMGRPTAGPSEQDVLAWHKKTTFVGFALREGAGFLALVGAMLTGQVAVAALMVGLVFVSMILAWPREDQLGNGIQA